MNSGKAYAGRYFDSSSTRARVVEVSLRAGKIIIEQAGLTSAPLSWDVKAIDSIEGENNKTVLKYGGLNDLQVLEIPDPEFIRDLQKMNPSLVSVKKSSSPFRYVIASLLFLLIAAFALIYFFVIPWIETKIADNFSKDTEAQMGRMMLQSFLSGEKVDTAASVLVNDFFAASKIKSDYKMHVTVVESPVVNAFALPGGELVVYTGILKDMHGYAELVALLGHETGHVQNRHSLKLLLKQFSLGLVLGTLFQNSNDLTSLFIQKAEALRQLSYSRVAEEEADLYGYEQMKQTGTDPHGMVELFKALETSTKDSPTPPEFLMTHPSIKSRIKNVEALINKEHYAYLPNSPLLGIWNKIRKSLQGSGSSF